MEKRMDFGLLTLKLAMMVLVLASCEKTVTNEEEDDDDDTDVTIGFTAPEWGKTRGELVADGKEMTDLWVIDYIGDELQQTVHQQKGDDAFGEPRISLSDGAHILYCVASRGGDATLDETTESISWEKPSDTFWAAYELNVTSGMDTYQTVTLHRVATRLRLTVTDEVPDGVSLLKVTPARWYYGVDYTTGIGVDDREQERTMTVPASYVGTTGKLTGILYGMSQDVEWMTSVTICAADAGGYDVSSVVINDVKLKMNRSTDYSGALFSKSVGVEIDESWDEPCVQEW